MEKDLYEISCELEGISGILTSLSNSYEEGNQRISDGLMTITLFSLSSYLERIVKDIEKIEEETTKVPQVSANTHETQTEITQ